MPFIAKKHIEIKTAEPFCGYVAPVAEEELDSVEMEAYDQASRLEYHVDEALKAALHIDEYQTVYSAVPGTSGEDPFDVIRKAIKSAEQQAAKGY